MAREEFGVGKPGGDRNRRRLPVRGQMPRLEAGPSPYLAFHFIERAASFSSIVGWGLEAGFSCFAACRAGGAVNALMESAMRLAFTSTLSTFTLTIWPVLTASDGSLMKRLESSLICTRPSWWTPISTKAPNLVTLVTTPSRSEEHTSELQSRQ